MKNKEITLVIGEKELKFNVALADYTRYINEVKADDKWSPSVRFCRATLVDGEQLADLNALIQEGLAVDIAGHLLEEFRPRVEIEVKK